MGNYSKFIGAIVGAVVGAVLTYAASKGVGVCDVNGCSIFGIGSDVVVGAVISVLTLAGVYVAPANKQ